jgi:hypothetical protein
VGLGDRIKDRARLREGPRQQAGTRG